MLTSLLIVALAQPGLVRMEPRRSGDASPFFEFAPASGAGMGAACACALPTGTKGEVMTFTRASSGTCLKTVGAAPQSIANGDMVTCTNDQPRVMSGTDGTSVNGVLNEGTRTNLVLRSEEFDNAAWTVANNGSVNPIVTANQGTAPDGTLTADRIQFSACPASTNASFILQTGRGAAGSNTGSVYCRGTSISQTISVCAFDDGANLGACTQIVCPATGWVRASQFKSVAVTTGGLVIGCNNASNYVGATSTGVADVLLWGAQYEAGTFASSYIKTVAASATRVADAANFAASIGTAVATKGSAAATITGTPPFSGAGGVVSFASSAGRALYTVNAASNVGFFEGTNDDEVSIAGLTQTSPKRIASQWGSGSSTVFNVTDSLSTPGSFSGTLTIGAGTYVGGNDGVLGALDGIIKQVCIDPSPSRCR